MPESRNACDVCGRRIVGKPQFRFFEGARLMVCEICARFAQKEQPPAPGTQDKFSQRTYAPKPKPKPKKTLYKDMELREDYADTIRKAREERKWTQTELANQIVERLSLIKRVEGGKMTPSEEVTQKLEKALGITLMVSTTDVPEVKMESKLPGDITLGDIVHLKTKKNKD